jgi:hypothetical protein
MIYRKPNNVGSAVLAGSSTIWSPLLASLQFNDGVTVSNSLSSGVGSYTNYITAYNYLPYIPSGSTLTEIRVRIGQAASTTGAFADKSVVLIKSAGVLDTVDKATATTYPLWAQPCAYQEYVWSAADLSGSGINVTVANSLNFGVAYAVKQVACFVRGTMIHTAGGLVPIENLRVGDILISYKEDFTICTVKVTANLQKKAQRVHTINGTVTASDGHPFQTPHGFTPVERLKVGDTIFRFNGTCIVPETLRSTSISKGETDVWHLSVEEPHTYFANGFAVHNKPAPPTIACDSILMAFGFSHNSARFSTY